MSAGDKDRQYLWHPFTQMAEWMQSDPLVIVRGEGVFLWDEQGRRYYDGNSSLWVNVHGHRHPHIDAAIREQLGRIEHSTMLGLTHPLAAELAERLAGIAPPGLERVFFSDNGSTAVEVALKVAYQYWRHRDRPEKTRFIALEEGYHGDTLGAVSVGGMGLFHSAFRSLCFDAVLAPCPGRGLGLEEALAGMERLLREHGDETAAVIMEPLIQGAGGMLTAPAGYLAGVAELCRRYDALLIVDEVATGFGRTGTMFACEREGVSPDLMCVAKGLTGGYLPLAATLTTAKVFEAFVPSAPERRVFHHGHSYTGNPLGCAAALASLEVFDRERVIEGLPPKIELVRRRLGDFAERPHVRETRQCGLMVGIELARDRDSGEPYPQEELMGARVCRRSTELGMITRPLGDVVVFMPPLCSSEEELTEMLDLLHQALIEVTEAP